MKLLKLKTKKTHYPIKGQICFLGELVIQLIYLVSTISSNLALIKSCH